MADWLKPFTPAIRGRAMARTPPVLARYLDDLARADRVAGDWDALAAAARGMDEVPPPRGPVPPADYDAAVSSMMPSRIGEPLVDALLRNDRTRALIDSRLDRLTPEQRPGSLGLVGRQYEADQAAARAAGIKAAEDRKTLAAIAALGATGAGAFAARVIQEANEQDRLAPLERDMQVADFVRSSADDIQLQDEPVPEFDAGLPSSDMASLADDMRRVEWLGRDGRPDGLLSDDPMMNLDLDSPDDAIASAPGPTIPVRRNLNIEELPGPQMRSVRALMRAGIPSGRAMDIIQGRANMSPDEYRMVTGGRR